MEPALRVRLGEPFREHRWLRVEHPFKFHLLDRCGEVHACDLDERVLSREEAIRELVNVYGMETASALPEGYL